MQAYVAFHDIDRTYLSLLLVTGSTTDETLWSLAVVSCSAFRVHDQGDRFLSAQIQRTNKAHSVTATL